MLMSRSYMDTLKEINMQFRGNVGHKIIPKDNIDCVLINRVDWGKLIVRGDSPCALIASGIQEGVVYEYKVFVVEQKLCPFTSCITEPGIAHKLRKGKLRYSWRYVQSNVFNTVSLLLFVLECFFS